MIKFEQQQRGEFVGGWVVVGGGGLHQLPISSSLGLDQKRRTMPSLVATMSASAQPSCAQTLLGPIFLSSSFDICWTFTKKVSHLDKLVLI